MKRTGQRGEGDVSRKKRELAEAQYCAANAAQARVIQQRLLWRPTIRLRGAQTAETQRERREERREEPGKERRGGGREQVTGLREEGVLVLLPEKSTSQKPSDLHSV